MVDGGRKDRGLHLNGKAWPPREKTIEAQHFTADPVLSQIKDTIP
jgi:hypothetical protein